MHTKDNNELMTKKINGSDSAPAETNFTDLPIEIVNEIGERSTYQNIQNLRATCSFFSNSLKQIVETKKPEIHLYTAKDRSYLLTPNGKLYVCGSNDNGILGYITDQNYKESISNFRPSYSVNERFFADFRKHWFCIQEKFQQVAAGDYYTAFLTEDGKILINQPNRPTPDLKDITLNTKFDKTRFQALVAHDKAFFALSCEGDWFLSLCYNSSNLELFKIDPANSPNVTLSPALPNQDIFAFVSQGKIYGIGINSNNGKIQTEGYVELFPELGGKVQSVVMQDKSTLIITTEGHLYGCGDYFNQELNLNHARDNKFSPYRIFLTNHDENTTIKQVGFSGLYIHVLTTEGDLYRAPLKADDRSFIKIMLDDKVQEFSANTDHTLVLTKNGKIYGMGCNQFGQLGFKDQFTGYAKTNYDIFEPCPFIIPKSIYIAPRVLIEKEQAPVKANDNCSIQ